MDWVGFARHCLGLVGFGLDWVGVARDWVGLVEFGRIKLGLVEFELVEVKVGLHWVEIEFT